jgi:hypothetical protein
MFFMFALVTACLSASVAENNSGYKILKTWDFAGDEKWTYGNEIINPKIKDSVLEFTASGNDPILYGPEYEFLPANNRQAVEIRVKADSPGTWEMFYAETNEGRFGGFSQERSLRFFVPSSDDWQTVRVSPFWGALEKTIRIRMDPACGRLEIDWIRIVELADSDDFVSWGKNKWFADQKSGLIEVKENLLEVKANEGGCTFFTFTNIDSLKSPILYLRANAYELENVSFCWANDRMPGLHSAGIQINPDDQIHTFNIDLSKFKDWQGNIDVVGFIFGEKADDKFVLGDFSLGDAPQGEPDFELTNIVAEPVIRRQGQAMTLSAYIRNTGAKTYIGGKASLILQDNFSVVGEKDQAIPTLKFNEKALLKWQLTPQKSGNLPIKINIDNKISLSSSIRVEPSIKITKTSYVPEPSPVDTKPYEIGIYYFPGWSPDQWDRWSKQKGFPERDPVLGFYREGDPEVADWHIKWAVENGITFFMYDWYWRDGKIFIEKGLEEGYLKAKYRDYMKFCVMWANHAPFADHTIEQLLEVTDYWIKNYFNLDCYYKIDGKPVVSFFAVDNLTQDLSGSENVGKAFDAMQKRVQSAGLPGIYFIACGDNSPNSQKRFKTEGYDAVSAYNYPTAGAKSSLWASYKSLMQGHVDIWNNSLRDNTLTYIPLLNVGWDSRPWHGNNALVRFGRSTEYFKDGLVYLKNWMDKNNRRIAILEAWNEWGEGSYMEPNSEFGFGDLEAIRDVFGKSGNKPQNVAPSDVGLGDYNIDIIDHHLMD